MVERNRTRYIPMPMEINAGQEDTDMMKEAAILLMLSK